MGYKSFFPFWGKKCVIADISLAGAHIEADSSFDPEIAIELFKEDLSQNLRQFGIEVGNSFRHQDIILAIQFTVIIQNATSAQMLGLGSPSEIETLNLPGNPPASLSSSLPAGPIVAVTGKILADGQELPEASAQARLSGFFLFDGSIGLLHKCFARAAEMLSSQIKTALINYYAGGAGTEPLSSAGAARRTPQLRPGLPKKARPEIPIGSRCWEYASFFSFAPGSESFSIIRPCTREWLQHSPENPQHH